MNPRWTQRWKQAVRDLHVDEDGRLLDRDDVDSDDRPIPREALLRGEWVDITTHTDPPFIRRWLKVKD